MKINNKFLLKNLILCGAFLMTTNINSYANISLADENVDTTHKSVVKNFGGSNNDCFISVAETQDGGFVTVGYSESTDAGFANNGCNDAIIVKYNKNGEQQWVKSFGGSNEDHFKSVIETQDKGFVAVGYSNSTDAGFANNGSNDAIIVKYDKHGNQQWLKNFGGSNDDYFYTVIETQDKEVIVVGNSNSTNAEFTTKGNLDSIIIKYDSEGNQQWIKSFGGSKNEYFESVIETKDKELVVVGHSSSTNVGFTNNGVSDAIIVKYDKDGNQLWVNNFGGYDGDYFYLVTETQDKGFVAVGDSWSDNAGFVYKGYGDAIIVKYNSEGKQEWVRSFGGSNDDYFFAVIEAQDGGIIVVGESGSTDAGFTNNGSYDAIIVKYDSNGNQQWFKSFGGSGKDSLVSIVEMQNGELIAVGFCNSNDAGFTNNGQHDAVIVKYLNSDFGQLERENASANLDIYIKSLNMLSLSLDTNSVTFENYSGVEDMEMLDAVNISINSSLPYQLNAYLPVETQNSDKSVTLPIDILNIKESSEADYKQFVNTTDKIVLKDGCTKGNDKSHSIDLKLTSNQAHKADVYKTVIKFEAEQK